MSHYDELMEFERQTQALGQIAGRLGWDQETVMPRGAGPQRAEESEALEHVLHARRTDPRVGDWLTAIDAASLGPVAQANVRHIQRRFDRTSRVPVKLAGEIARVTSSSQRIWADARAENDFKAFAPVLEKVVELKRHEAEALAIGGDPYDALLDD